MSQDSQDSQATYDAIVAELVATSSTVSGKMFGMPSLKINGKAFAGFYHGAMVFKLPPPQHTEALALSGAQLFDPSGRGRPMKEWVEVPFEHHSHWSALAQVALKYADMPQ